MRGLSCLAIVLLVALGLVSNSMAASKGTKPKCTAAETSELAKLREKCGDEASSDEEDDSYECSDEDLDKLEMLEKKCGSSRSRNLLQRQKQQGQQAKCPPAGLEDCKERGKTCVPKGGVQYVCQ